MRRVQSKQTIKLQLLALVLALALVWYSLNPAPGPVVIRKKPADLPPEEKKRNARPQNISVALSEAFRPIEETAKHLSSHNKEEDDFDWPEFINA